MIVIKVEAFQKLRKQIEQLKGETQRLISIEMDKAQISAIIIAKKLVPVDTGRLRQSIGPVGRRGLDRSFGSNVEYAAKIEFGDQAPTSKLEGIPSLFAGGEGPIAQPYLRPAADEVVESTEKRIVKIIEKEIEKST